MSCKSLMHSNLIELCACLAWCSLSEQQAGQPARSCPQSVPRRNQVVLTRKWVVCQSKKLYFRHGPVVLSRRTKVDRKSRRTLWHGIFPKKLLAVHQITHSYHISPTLSGPYFPFKPRVPYQNWNYCKWRQPPMEDVLKKGNRWKLKIAYNVDNGNWKTT